MTVKVERICCCQDAGCPRHGDAVIDGIPTRLQIKRLKGLRYRLRSCDLTVPSDQYRRTSIIKLIQLAASSSKLKDPMTLSFRERRVLTQWNRFPCSYPGCTKIFVRLEHKSRHEATVHKADVLSRIQRSRPHDATETMQPVTSPQGEARAVDLKIPDLFESFRSLPPKINPLYPQVNEESLRWLTEYLFPALGSQFCWKTC